MAALEAFRPQQSELARMMEEKVRLEFALLAGAAAAAAPPERVRPAARGGASQKLRETMAELRARLVALDERIAPLAKASGEILNQRWGLLMRAGNDKSHLARQVERYADIYTSRVSNFLYRDAVRLPARAARQPAARRCADARMTALVPARRGMAGE